MQDYVIEPKEGFRERRGYEILDGKMYNMARPSISHNIAGGNIFRMFGNFLKGKKCRAFMDGASVYLSEKDRAVPDVMIVCNRDIIKKNGIYGAPDLIVEVLSRTTAKNDLNYKKNLYEKSGVKEYWIVSAEERFIQVYVLKDAKYELSDIYQSFRDEDLSDLTDDEKAAIIYEFKTSLDGFEDLIINVEEVFENVE